MKSFSSLVFDVETNVFFLPIFSLPSIITMNNEAGKAKYKYNTTTNAPNRTPYCSVDCTRINRKRTIYQKRCHNNINHTTQNIIKQSSIHRYQLVLVTLIQATQNHDLLQLIIYFHNHRGVGKGTKFLNPNSEIIACKTSNKN